MKKVYLDDGPKAIAMDCKRWIVMFIDTVDGPINKSIRLSVEITMKTARSSVYYSLDDPMNKEINETKLFSRE